MKKLGLLVLAVLVAMSIATDVRAADDLPATLIAQLAMKVASYDKNQVERQKTRPRTLVFENASDERSVRTASMVAQTLREPDIGKGAPIEVVAFSSPLALAAAVEARSACIVILATGLEESAGAIADALAGKSVLTIGTTGALAERGAVIGFELREGKPKIVVNQRRAKDQNVVLKADLLALARIVP